MDKLRLAIEFLLEQTAYNGDPPVANLAAAHKAAIQKDFDALGVVEAEVAKMAGVTVDELEQLAL